MRYPLIKRQPYTKSSYILAMWCQNENSTNCHTSHAITYVVANLVGITQFAKLIFEVISNMKVCQGIITKIKSQNQTTHCACY